MTTTITRRFQFCSGHRVYKHESKCNHLHGHNYVALVEVTAPELDSIGRIIDFSEVKRIVGGWIDRFWDHGMILKSDDPVATMYPDELPGHKLWLMADNPTAENMARVLMGVAQQLLPEPMHVSKVTLWETENCYAEVTP